MLIGPRGSGKLTLAIKLAETVLGLSADSFANYPYKSIIEPEDGKAIGIEKVRELEHFLSLKVPGKAEHNRAVIITEADLLTTEAQNALLKTLEEPPAGCLIILAVSHPEALLPTIRSRSQSLNPRRPPKTALETYFQADHDAAAIKRAYAVSGGLPGLMQAVLSETDHPLTQATELARRILSSTAYERLLLVDELAKDRSQALNTVFIMQQMAHVSLQTAEGPPAAKWQAVLTAAYDTERDLRGSAQPKLALLSLMLSL
jgi:DNA polymerase III delta prime subunit